MIWAEKKELDADHKATQQIEFVEQLKNVNGINTDLVESMFVLTNLEKNLKKRLKFPQRSVTVLQITANCQEAGIYRTNTQLN